MPRAKKFKVKIEGIEISAEKIQDFKFIMDAFSKCAAWERSLGHLKECENYQHINDSIIENIGEQI